MLFDDRSLQAVAVSDYVIGADSALIICLSVCQSVSRIPVKSAQLSGSRVILVLLELNHVTVLKFQQSIQHGA